MQKRHRGIDGRPSCAGLAELEAAEAASAEPPAPIANRSTSLGRRSLSSLLVASAPAAPLAAAEERETPRAFPFLFDERVGGLVVRREVCAPAAAAPAAPDSPESSGHGWPSQPVEGSPTPCAPRRRPAEEEEGGEEGEGGEEALKTESAVPRRCPLLFCAPSVLLLKRLTCRASRLPT